MEHLHFLIRIIAVCCIWISGGEGTLVGVPDSHLLPAFPGFFSENFIEFTLLDCY